MKLTLKLIAGLGISYLCLLSIPGYGPVDDVAFYKNTGFAVIAHRGGRGLAPGNTIEAAVNAVDIGSDIICLCVTQRCYIHGNWLFYW